MNPENMQCHNYQFPPISLIHLDWMGGGDFTEGGEMNIYFVFNYNILVHGRMGGGGKAGGTNYRSPS